MKKKLIDIYYVWVEELKLVVQDPAAILLFVIVPFIYPIIYGYLYNGEVVSEVPVVVVDDSHSALGREFVRGLDASHDIFVIGTVANMEDAQEAMRRKEAFGILYIPSDFSKRINSQQQAQVQVFADMSSLLYYKAMLLGATEVSLKMGADIRVAEMGNKTMREDEVRKYAVQEEWVPYYNPAGGFASFLIPAVLIVVIQQTLLIGIATIVGTQNDRKRFAIPSPTQQGKKINAASVTISKALAYVTVYSLMCVWVFRVVPYIFNLPQIGHPITIAVFLLPFLLACTFFGMMLSYFCSQREFSMLLFASSSVLILFLSGVSWPWDAIPSPLKAIAYLFPSTSGIHGFVKINTMGATLASVSKEYIILWGETLVYWLGATLMYKWWVRNYVTERIE